MASWPSDTDMVSGGGQDDGHRMAFGGNSGHRHSHRPQWGKTMEPDMAFSGSLSQDIIIASGGKTDHSDQFGPPNVSMPSPAPTSTWSQATSQTTALLMSFSGNVSPDPDMALGSLVRFHIPANSPLLLQFHLSP